MGIKTYKIFVLFFFFIITCNSHLFSWGFKAHKYINHTAILFLPKELMPFYKRYHLYISQHSVDPDKRKRFQKDEKYKHYINLDVYDTFPFVKLPQKIKIATEVYGKDEITKNGILPWHIQKVCHQLTKAFKEKNADKILKLSADLGHYIGDATVPLHITKNYNGQLSNQEGIHGLWETQCLEHIDVENLSINIKSTKYIEAIDKEIWKTILESYALVDKVLETEKEISKHFSEAQKYSIKTVKNKIQKKYNKDFVMQYLELSQKMIKEQLYNASFLLACLYYTCWVNAGQPDLSNVSAKSIPQP